MTSTNLDDQDIVGFNTDEGPYAFYSRIREEEPVFWSERLQRWILTRYDDVFAAYRNTQVFSSQTFASRGAGTALGEPAQDRVVDTFTKQILFLDRPEHTRLRRLVSNAFTPRSVEAIRGYTADLTKTMLDDLQDGEFDFVRSFAGPLPLSVVSEIFGVDVGDRDLYRAWSDSLAFITSPNQPVEELRTAFKHVDEMRAYLEDLVEARRKGLRDDLLSRMIEVDDGGDRLTTEEIVAMAMIITAAGHETTTSLLVNSLRLLLNDPERTVRIGADAAFRKSCPRGDPSVGASSAVQYPGHDRGFRAARDGHPGWRSRGACSRWSQPRPPQVRTGRAVRPREVTEPAPHVRQRGPRLPWGEPGTARGRRGCGHDRPRLPHPPGRVIGRAQAKPAVPRVRLCNGRLELNHGNRSAAARRTPSRGRRGRRRADSRTTRWPTTA